MEGCTFHVVVPADEDGEGAGSAQGRLEEALQRLGACGTEATGEVGLADPMDAIRHAMAADSYMGIILTTPHIGASRWLHRDLPHRVEREFNVTVEWIEAHGDSPDEATTVHTDLPSSDKTGLNRSGDM
jgi:hypothetical protein